MIFTLLVASLALAANPDFCHAPSARHLSLPLYPDNPTRSETFDYTYAIGGEASDDHPWIVVLPGGPGQASIGMPLAMPQGFPVLRIDPRGVGCNAEPEIPVDALPSALAAADVAAVIRHENIKSYLIYGASYGTLMATLVTSRLENDGGPAPKAVVLEGVLAHAFGPGEYFKVQLSRWENLRKQLSPLTLKELSATPPPLGIPSLHWASYIASLLYVGEVPGGTGDFALQQLESLRNSKLRPFMKPQIEAIVDDNVLGHARVFREVDCREIAPDMRDMKFDFDLVKGHLVPRNTQFCRGIEPGPLYDSAKIQIRSPIYYFSGLLDPATPPDQARYHFQHHAESARTLVTVPNGSHLALTLNLSDCAPALWEAIAAAKPLDPILSTCMTNPKPKVELAPAR